MSAKIQGRENNAVLAVSNPRRTLRGGASTLEEHTGLEAIGVLRQDIDYELIIDLIYGGMIMPDAGEKGLTHGWANTVVDLLWRSFEEARIPQKTSRVLKAQPEHAPDRLA